MSPVARSVFVYSFYMLGAGALLALVPNILLPLVGLPDTGEPWIRLLGLLSFATGLYYIVAARHNLVPFFRISVWGRVLFAGGLSFLVGLHLIGVTALLFAFVEFVGAVWTAWTLTRLSEVGITEKE